MHRHQPDTVAGLLQELCEDYDVDPHQRISTLIEAAGDDEVVFPGDDEEA